MLFRPTTVRDDRGRRITLSLGENDSKAHFKAHQERVSKLRAERTKARERAEESRGKKPLNIWLRRLRDWPLYVLFACAAMLGGIGFLAGIVLAASAPLMGVAVLLGLDWRTGIIMTIGVGMVIGAIVGIRHRDTNRYQQAKRLVAIRICGACGYSLENLEPAADGFLQCPECGAAWNSVPQRPECSGCHEPLNSITVNQDGSAECSTCGHPYTFAPGNADPGDGPPPAPPAI